MSPNANDPSLSDNVRGLAPSATLAVSALAKSLRSQGRDIINLSAGEPDFPTPEFIAEAGIRAIEAGNTRYTPTPGLPELRQAIADNLAAAHDIQTVADGVVVSTGAKQALFNVMFALIGPGNRVLVPVPYWTSYPEITKLCRATMVPVSGPQDRGYRVGPDELESAWTEGTRALILNTPSNPSGSVYRLEELEAIAEWARRRGVWVISDEIYGRLCYVADRAPGLLDLPEELRDRVVVINGASKAYAMTGWRIGYSYATPALSRTLAALQSHVTSNAATPSQHAAIAAFRATEAQELELSGMVEAFRGRRDLVVRLLEETLPGTSYVAPEGAFYLFFNAERWLDEARPDSAALCTWLIQEAEVALVPGSAFGDDRYVRLSFAASRDALDESFRRLGRALGSAS